MTLIPNRFPHIFNTFATLTALTLGAGAARADGFLITSGGLAHECYVAAKSGKIGDHDLRLCTYALDQDALDSHDRAGTYINRGTLYLKRRAYEDGLKDFDAAVKLGPDIGEAHVNRGAALVGLRRFAEARAELDRGLALNPSEPEKAYFNRATARELLGDVAGAYADYTKAVELAPGWQPPLDELKRFKVEKKTE